jgi:general secretion pathway protein M
LRWGPSNSRFLALGLLALLSLAAFQLIAAPLLTAYPEVAGRIEHSHLLLRRYRALSAQRAQLSARLEAVKNAVADSIAYLKGSSDTLAGAALQNHVRSIVEGAGGELRSSQILPVESIEPEISVRRVALKLHLKVEIVRLQDLLYEFETAQPCIFIEEITILRGTVSRLGGDAETNQMLEVMLEVYGFSA